MALKTKMPRFSDKFISVVFGADIGPKFEGENLSESFSAETEFCKIDP
jgi:hypothetical protein